MAKEEERRGRKEASSRARAVIDRIEDGGLAVLLINDGKAQFELPVSLLPEGASDGDHLSISISLDRRSRTETEERIKRLQEELRGRSGTDDEKDFKL